MIAALNGAVLALAPTNLLTLVAVGLFNRQYGMRRSVALTLVLGAGAAVGALVIASAIRGYPAAETQLGLGALAAIFAAAAYRPPMPVAVVTGFIAGVALALSTPPQMITIAGAVVSQIASGVAGAFVVLLVALLAIAAEGGWRTIALRVIGSWIAASAILALTLRLAR